MDDERPLDVDSLTLDASVGYRPTPAGAAALERTRAFVAEVALPMVDHHARQHGDSTFALEADGRLGAAQLGLKRRMQAASAEAGLYCPHLAKEDGGLGLGLV